VRAKTLSALIATVALLLAACGGGDDPGAGSSGSADTTDGATTAGATTDDDTDGDTTDGDVTLATASTDLGTILADDDGRTLYVFDNDTDGESTCYDQCAANWPALTGAATATGELDASLLGTTQRTDGSTQVTYAGHPLYYFAGDSAPGDVNGQGVGDVWWVLAPDGTKMAAAGNDEQDADEGSANYG